MDTLTPLDGRKSFYGKCEVINNYDTVELKSYDTIVAVYYKTREVIVINGWYSSTTARHINAFLSMFGLPSMSKKELDDCGLLKAEYVPESCSIASM
jgi:hypothetical protein